MFNRQGKVEKAHAGSGHMYVFESKKWVKHARSSARIKKTSQKDPCYASKREDVSKQPVYSSARYKKSCRKSTKKSEIQPDDKKNNKK